MDSFVALADPTRREIIEMLSKGSLTSGEIAARFRLTAPAISQHLQALCRARLVKVRPEAQRRIYELDRDGVEEVSRWIDRIRLVWNRKVDPLDPAGLQR